MLALVSALLFSYSTAVQLELGQAHLSPNLNLCPIAGTYPQPTGVDSVLRATNPPACTQLGTFEPYNGKYTILSTSPPEVTRDCFVGPAARLFDNNIQSEWNAYPGNATTIYDITHNLGGVVTSSVSFITQDAINPTVFAFKPHGSPANGFTSSYLEGRASVVAAWERVGTFTLPSTATSAEYGFKVNTGGKFFSLWRWTITPTDTVAIREAHFYVEPSPVRAQASPATRYPHNYEGYNTNNSVFDNSFGTYYAFGAAATVDSPLIVDFYYESVLSDNVVGLFWATSGALSNGVTKSKLVPYQKDGLYGLWGDGTTLKTSGFGPISNWKSIPSYSFSFFALGNAIQLSEVNFVLCPKFTCPCSLPPGSSQGPLSCSTSSTFCTVQPDPIVPIPLKP